MKEFVDDNQAFIKEILALEAEVPEGTEFQTDINENVRKMCIRDSNNITHFAVFNSE